MQPVLHVIFHHQFWAAWQRGCHGCCHGWCCGAIVADRVCCLVDVWLFQARTVRATCCWVLLRLHAGSSALQLQLQPVLPAVMSCLQARMALAMCYSTLLHLGCWHIN
jgi:hypothetical protein